MKNIHLILCFLCITQISFTQPLSLHPQNPHIFFFKGKPTLIIGSGEHYGAVMNLDFDYKKYLKTLNQDGLNITRLFTGPYREDAAAFGIERNTMAPPESSYLCAWSRTDGRKYDLSQWNVQYFSRLKDFMQEADKQGVLVEICLFTSFYGAMWKMSPFHPSNNVNNTEDVPYKTVQGISTPTYKRFQEAYVRKMVQELKDFDNFYFEIQNEPWSDGSDTVFIRNEYYQPDELKQAGNHWRCQYERNGQASLAWQKWIASVIKDAEKGLPKKHLISQNVANFEQPVSIKDPTINLFTFHYSSPQAVSMNYYLNRPIGFNETGFAGRKDETYRRQAWRFILSGGALFNHLDYSFSVGKEDGTDISNNAPGGGSPAFRKQMGVLKNFMESLDLVNFKPDNQIVAGANAFSLAQSNRINQFVIYFESLEGFTATLALPKGRFKASWINPTTGETVLEQNLTVLSKQTVLSFNEPLREVVLKIQKL
jgi:Family of unknown function (DUF6298)